jgi:hypothetical protein
MSDRSFDFVDKEGYILQTDIHGTLTREEILSAVKRNPLFICRIEDDQQDEEICMASVEQHGVYLPFIVNKTLPVCLAAVRQNPKAICYVPEDMRLTVRNALDNEKRAILIHENLYLAFLRRSELV